MFSLAQFLALLAIFARIGAQQLGKPGGAGYAIILNNNPLVLDTFQNFPTEELTFEAWISTYYTCHPGTLMSYALDSTEDIERNLNHFVVSHLTRVLGCHDYRRTYLSGLSGAVLAAVGIENCFQDFFDAQEELEADPEVARNGTWSHVAVTWSRRNSGETIVYKDGEIVGRSITNKTQVIQPNGIFMLGGKQACYGGCSLGSEAYNGLMDEVRIWNTTRSQTQMQDFMTQTGDILRDEEGLVAYWNFDDPSDEDFDEERLARDLSGNGNDLALFSPPLLTPVTITKEEETLEAGALVFQKNFAINRELSEMPKNDLSIEFWARLLVRPFDEEHNQNLNNSENRHYLFSYTSLPPDQELEDSSLPSGLTRGALAMYVDLNEWNNTRFLRLSDFSSRGSVWVGFGGASNVWIEFDTKWLDTDWHHIVLTHNSRHVRLFFDGEESTPFWKNNGEGAVFLHPAEGGVEPTLSVEERSSAGSLVLGQFQDCYGGCFISGRSFSGMLANFRIWNRPLTKQRIRNLMMDSLTDSNPDSLVLQYRFENQTILGNGKTGQYVLDQNGSPSLFLGSMMPHFEFSTAPLTRISGRALDPPSPGDTGYALQLSDQHIVVLSNFSDFPTEAITIEFSMWSIDKCSSGVPFSYSVDLDGRHVDMFTLTNYNNWMLVVNGDVGGPLDALSGVSSTDGLWHHIAVTWNKQTGEALLYDNGRLHWRGIRNQGESLVSGGTLVVGREQDCLGGCFDSAENAFNGSARTLFENIQDFFGLIDNMRVWNIVRTPQEIQQSLRFDLDLEEGIDNEFITSSSEGLVAWWRFDEGQGRRVSDSTLNVGHTLRIRGRPSWVVSNRLEACGDGILNSAEECDDGNRRDGDGCASDCRLEAPSPLEEEDEVIEMLESSIESPRPSPSPDSSPTSVESPEDSAYYESDLDDDIL